MTYKPAAIMLAAGAALLTTAPMTSQKPIDEESIQLIESIQGPALYSAYCAVCHGADAKGGGPMASSLRSPTPDLTMIAARNKGRFPLAKVQRIISGEEQLPGGHGTREMPVWGPIFSQIAWDQDLGRVRVLNLARHIESLQTRRERRKS